MTTSKSSTPLPQDCVDTLAVTKAIQELVLIIFIHGFRGTNSTFAEFPSRVENILTRTVPGIKAECIVFPVYEVGRRIFFVS